jgi:hypothetical protein
MSLSLRTLEDIPVTIYFSLDGKEIEIYKRGTEQRLTKKEICSHLKNSWGRYFCENKTCIEFLDNRFDLNSLLDLTHYVLSNADGILINGKEYISEEQEKLLYWLRLNAIERKELGLHQLGEMLDFIIKRIHCQ